MAKAAKYLSNSHTVVVNAIWKSGHGVNQIKRYFLSENMKSTYIKKNENGTHQSCSALYLDLLEPDVRDKLKEGMCTLRCNVGKIFMQYHFTVVWAPGWGSMRITSISVGAASFIC